MILSSLKSFLDKILLSEDEGNIGYLVEVDLDNPDELYDKHAHYPPVPDKEPINLLEMSHFKTSQKRPSNWLHKNQKAETDLPPQKKLCASLS